MAMVELIRDGATRGANIIISSHDHTVEIVLKYLPQWLKIFLPRIPIFFGEAGEPFLYK
ncbi:MAG: hypothetical protein HPY85_07060 [Anaerolineae bacterium]|nr:hypothetical protein [Anaerolineae bacterium]